MPAAVAYKQLDIRDQADQQSYGNIPRSVFRALHHAGLSPAARSIYQLHWFSGRAAGTWTTKLTVSQIATELCMAESTVKAAHRNLEKEGWISRTEQPRYRHDPFRSPPAITEVLIPEAFRREVLTAGKRSTQTPRQEDDQSSKEGTELANTNSARRSRNPAARPEPTEKELRTGPPTGLILTSLLSRLDKAERQLVRRWAMRVALNPREPFPELPSAEPALSQRIQECFEAGCVETIQANDRELEENPSVPLSGVGKRRPAKLQMLARRPDLAKARTLIHQAAREARLDPELHWASVQQAYMDRSSWFHRHGISDLASITRIAAAKIRKLEWRVQSGLDQGRK